MVAHVKRLVGQRHRQPVRRLRPPQQQDRQYAPLPDPDRTPLETRQGSPLHVPWGQHGGRLARTALGLLLRYPPLPLLLQLGPGGVVLREVVVPYPAVRRRLPEPRLHQPLVQILPVVREVLHQVPAIAPSDSRRPAHESPITQSPRASAPARSALGWVDQRVLQTFDQVTSNSRARPRSPA